MIQTSINGEANELHSRLKTDLPEIKEKNAIITFDPHFN